jgi:D-alanine transaminase
MNSRNARGDALASWNGQEMPLSEVKVSVLDRAFMFGDAVYEVLRVYGTKIWRFNDHFKRLAAGLNALKIAGIDMPILAERTVDLLANSDVEEGLIYIQITRGEAKRSHCYPAEATPNQLIYVDAFDDPYRELRMSGASVITRPDSRWARNDIKVTSLVANCMAAQEAVENNCVETLLIDGAGLVTEGSHSSVFGVRGGELLISPAGKNVLPGITKQQVIYLSNKCKIPRKEHQLVKEDLQSLDELFVTGTPEEILPIVRVDGLPVADGSPGRITSVLRDAYKKRVSDWLAAL